MDYAEEVYGEDSAETARARGALVELLNTEAQQARQVGNMAEAYALATAAAREMKNEHERLNAMLENGLRVGSAYTQYLRAIGKEKEADAYERTNLAGDTARRAQQLFAEGDMEAGYRTAAQAETLARSGMETKGGGRIAGRGKTAAAGRALTAALHPATLAAAQQQSVIHNHVRVEVRDEQGNMRRVSKVVRAETDRQGYFRVFAQ